MPSRLDFDGYINRIWDKQWLTNSGPLANEFEDKLKSHFGLPNLLFVTNGTVAIQLAIEGLMLKGGDIITTPFSFVATTSCIVWQGCKPVFVDIDEDTLNIDPLKIEAAITPKTVAILATHVFGNPCHIDAIQAIADKHGLKVIYDAAHCFGVKYKGKPIFGYGDASTISFHATKLFHTVEGGAVFTKSAAVLERIGYMRNFGYSAVDTFSELGTNAKNSEFHAAMGLCNLKHVSKLLVRRQVIYQYYKNNLKKLDIAFQQINPQASFNHAYFPVIFASEESMLHCKQELDKVHICCRRYFYPSLSALPYVERVYMPICDDVAKRIMCLPMFHTLSKAEMALVVGIMAKTLGQGVKWKAAKPSLDTPVIVPSIALPQSFVQQ